MSDHWLRFRLMELVEAVGPILVAHRSTSARITKEQMEAAWAAYDSARATLGEKL